MAHSVSAEKRIRQNERRRVRNRMTKSKIRTASKAFLTAVSTKNNDAAKQAYSEVEKLIDTATGKGVVHKNTAARTKSRFHKKLTEIQA